MHSDTFVNPSWKKKVFGRQGCACLRLLLLASIANRLLNEAYGDSGDNPLIPRADVRHSQRRQSTILSVVNYSSTNLSRVKNTLNVLENIPGVVITNYCTWGWSPEQHKPWVCFRMGR